MSDSDRIADQLLRSLDGDAWYGPSVSEALRGVDARVATARPVPSVHSILEILLHMTAWTREVTRRLGGGIPAAPAEGDWPLPAAGDVGEWAAVLSAFRHANAELLDAIRTSGDAELHDPVGDVRDRPLGSGVSRYVMLHGVIQHHAYHAGQISLLRKASGR